VKTHDLLSRVKTQDPLSKVKTHDLTRSGNNDDRVIFFQKVLFWRTFFTTYVLSGVVVDVAAGVCL
jgi:hypothetical protein